MWMQVSASLESKHVTSHLMCDLAIAGNYYYHYDGKDVGYVICADIVEIFRKSLRVFFFIEKRLGVQLDPSMAPGIADKIPSHSSIPSFRFFFWFDTKLVISTISCWFAATTRNTHRSSTLRLVFSSLRSQQCLRIAVSQIADGCSIRKRRALYHPRIQRRFCNTSVEQDCSRSGEILILLRRFLQLQCVLLLLRITSGSVMPTSSLVLPVSKSFSHTLSTMNSHTFFLW